MATNTLYRFGKLGSKYFAADCNSMFQNYSQKRYLSFLWIWATRIFNAVDKERLDLMGPDRACAEWLLRNGATVRFKGQSDFINDYNVLIALEESPESARFRIEEIYAEDAGISENGFDHLKGCNHINKVKFVFCSLLDNRAMFKLNYISKSLQSLEIRSCFNISDEGILSLTHLRNLRKLILSDLVSVKNKNECETALKKALVKCDIDFRV